MKKTATFYSVMFLSAWMIFANPGEAAAAPTGDYYVTVTASSVFVNKVHGEGEVLTEALQGAAFDITEDFGDGWIQVQIGSETGYMRKDSGVTITGAPAEEPEDGEETGTEEIGPHMDLLEEEEGTVSEARQNLVDYAMQFLGGRYADGGSDPNTGADCSGFTQYVVQHGAGVSIPRSSRAQSGAGTEISAEQMRPGDLIFYAKGGRINHVALYIGDEQVIHASTYKTGIKLSPWNYRNPVKIINVMGD